MIMWAMSDRAIPRSFRFMEGFGVHTFRLVNADGKSHFVKFTGSRSSACSRSLGRGGEDKWRRPGLPPPRPLDSWAEGGPRADPKRGFRSFPEPVSGEKRKLRAESFADHYSQARLFYRSQTPVE